MTTVPGVRMVAAGLSRRKQKERPHDSAAPLVLALGAVRADDRQRVGGKAATLTLLLRAGLPVPAGFCLTTGAFRRFLVSSRAGPLISELATAANCAAGERLRSHLLSEPIPPDLEHAILSAWDGVFAGAACAVRSSATAEDLLDASFAGQQDTFLNVDGRDALLDAVRHCWVSIFSDRALAYRARHGIDHTQVAMAVIVQELVPAEVAGVMFTINPLTGRTAEVLIEASYGLGEAVVSGRVSPDRFVIHRDTQAVRRTVASKSVQIMPDSGGGVREQAVRSDVAATACLSDALARRIAKLGLAAERLFGAPQDIEWAVARGDVFVLQSRPITTQPTRPPAEAHQVWTNMNVGEVLPDVVSPMTWSFLEKTLLRLFKDLLRRFGFDLGHTPLLGLVAGRAYFNLNTTIALVRSFPGGRSLDLTAMFGGLHAELEAVGGFTAIDAEAARVSLSRWRMLRQLPRLIAWSLKQSAATAERNLAAVARRLDEQQRRDLGGTSEVALIAELNACVDEFREAMPTLGGYAVVGMSHFRNLDALCRRWFPEEHGVANQLLTGMGGMPSAEAGLDMWRLAAAAHGSADVEQALLGSNAFAAVRATLGAIDGGAAFLARWDAFMARHGHHARGEIDLKNPRWSEEPDGVLAQIRSYLRHMGGKDPVALHRAQAGERERRTAAFRSRLNPAKRLVFDFELPRAQRGILYRENLRNQGVRQFAVMRQIALELGRRVTARGVLQHADDIFFVELNELQELRDVATADGLQSRIAQRQAEYERNQSLTPPAVVVGRFDPSRIQPDTADEGVERLSGLGVSPGVVTGPAHVILRSTTDERILPGEILVAPFTDPGWTPYFQLAAGLVTDLGGLLSHGSIVAREYGLPAVVNVGPATRIIRTGDELQVDGARGEVRILRRARGR